VSPAKRKWPHGAVHVVRVHLTAKQIARWQEARDKINARELDLWVVRAVDFFAWYVSRERKLMQGVNKQLEVEARDRIRRMQEEPQE
jgi:hypothetical protein